MAAPWQSYHEPLRATLLRNGGIAFGLGALLAWRQGGVSQWPSATLLALWFSLGGHWVELWFLNWLRPRLPRARGLQMAARVATWFAGGAALAGGMALTLLALPGHRPALWHAWWVGGIGFIGLELVVHSLLHLRRRPSFYDGRG